MTEKIDEIWNEIDVVVENDFVQRHIVCDKVFNFFRDIENNNYANDQKNGKEERSEKFPQNVTVKYG